jgi:hypothetical protein
MQQKTKCVAKKYRSKHISLASTKSAQQKSKHLYSMNNNILQSQKYVYHMSNIYSKTPGVIATSRSCVCSKAHLRLKHVERSLATSQICKKN